MTLEELEENEDEFSEEDEAAIETYRSVQTIKCRMTIFCFPKKGRRGQGAKRGVKANVF